MTDNEPREGDLVRAAGIIRRARYSIALVGAGMSRESGIPTFRGDDGLWTRYGEPDMMGYQRFVEDPKGWWERRNAPDPRMQELAVALESARPNPGHYAMAEMERLGYLKHIITQNVDNLHHEAGSLSVTEIHGNRHKLRCLSCGQRFWLTEFTFTELPPRCPHCGGLIKSDTVMFGEPIPSDALQTCFAESEKAD
ncbi:MAG TPA: Sir2 family NAD-dependent protein deacetylase, partial [Dehalococcoidia bacterium]|nr:Sir2 family NAD-dependent protein deacetylase [Dehalococcoidia bacterium]